MVGGLGRGGAEKQFLYMVGSLRRAGHAVHVVCLTEGDPLEGALRETGATIDHVQKGGGPLARSLRIAQLMRPHRPALVQSSHFFTNIYAGIAGRICRVPSIGAIRNDVSSEVQDSGRLGRLQLTLPTALIANSVEARDTAEKLGIAASRLHVLTNVIDLTSFAKSAASDPHIERQDDQVVVTAVGRQVSQKRFDRFLEALAIARRRAPQLKGWIVGDGQLRTEHMERADRLGLTPDGVEFLGERSDVAAILRRSDVFVLSSDHEGFPNVVLEAMAAHLAVVATPAGNARSLVESAGCGFVVEFEDVEGMAARLVTLATDATGRRQFGQQGGAAVAERYDLVGLDRRLIEIYRQLGVRN